MEQRFRTQLHDSSLVTFMVPVKLSTPLHSIGLMRVGVDVHGKTRLFMNCTSARLPPKEPFRVLKKNSTILRISESRRSSSCPCLIFREGATGATTECCPTLQTVPMDVL